MEADERDQAPPFAGAGARPRRPGDRTRRADFRTRQVSRRQETRREEQTLNGQEAASENKWPSPLRDATHNEPDHDKHIYTTSNSETGDRSSRPTGQTVNSTAQSEAGAKTRRRRCFRSGGHQDGRGGGPRADCPRLLYSPHHRLRLVVMAALLGCLLAAALAGQRARGYQLANNLIANNLPPRFVQSGGSGAASTTTNSEIVVRVKEGPASIGKLIYTLKGEDPDEDPLTFGVLGTMASELLRVENVPGNQANVYLRKELDRETTESHQVVITLTDGKLGRGNWVEDVNDNYPVFGPHRTAISIREDARAPLVIETIEATDADEGRFGQVIYKLDESAAAAAEQPGGDPSGRSASAPSIAQMFQIDTVDGKGVISLIGQLDFEQRPLYQLRVLAIDRAQENERLSTSTSILVSVEDCEDQPPMFTFAPSITRIPEDLPAGSAVVRVSAIDGDRGVNNPIKYSLVSVNNQETGFERNLFSIGSDSGQISVAHELDRELTMEPARAGTSGASSNQPGAYVLQVRATELGQSSGLLEGLFASGSSAANSVTTELTVILIDVNDELPTFNRDKFFGELLENSPAESLVSFVQGRGEFAQQPSPGQAQQLVGAKVFDRDQGTNGTFTLHLEGEHGHLFEVWPSEATNEATLMIKVAASAASASNAKFFDYETNKELRLTLVAREKFPPPGGAERRQSSAEMLVQLRDTNDNYPQFDTDLYRVEIPENAIRGMHICAVKAADLDSGALGSAGVRYTEIRGERANKFKLDPVTGVITLRTNEHGFDREQTAQHHLIVEARDNLGLGNRNTTQLMIVLTDVNDQRPKFLLDQYEAFIYENELDFQSPLQVQASDLDAPNTQNSRLTYSIVGGDAQRNFTIDPTTGRIRVRTTLVASQPAGARHASFDLDQAQSAGALTLGELEGANVVQATGLDFERIPQKRDETRQFNLTIRASDGGLPEPLSSTTQVVVVVYDKNDHAPVFSRPVYARSIREDAPGGSAVIQVQAQDGDHSPANSKITYRISSGASDKFVIDSDSGLISVANGANLDIDRVQGGGQRRTGYLLNVLASDGSFGQNQKSASALVNVTIIDVNNKAPEFVSSSTGGQQGAAAGPANQQQQPVVFVNEDAPYGLIVTRVFATDLDSSAELRFSINYARSEARNEDMILVEPGVYRDVFAIDPLDGTIKVNKQLDRELFDQVKLRLQVEDLAAQTADQVAHSHLLVRITDVNDNRPAFKRPVYKAVVNENSISGTSVTTMAADDRDLNKTLRYSLEASSPELARLVRINPRSGEVTVNDKIDRELFPLINVTVKAEDSGQPHSLTGSAQLIITVRDENDNNPIFLNSTHLRPSQARHSDPSSTAAANQTGPNNHNMHYRSSSLAGPSSYRLRSLGPHSAGAPSGRFLSEQGQPPVLELIDGSNQHYPETSYFGLAAAPSDENGRELALLAPGSSAQVREDAAVGHQIAYVRAEDADVGNNGRVTYLLDPNSNADGKFRIERDSGILSVAQPLDREHQKQYALIIEACDNFDLGYSTGESRRAFTQVNVQVTDVNDNAPTISTNLQASPSAGLPAAPSSGASASFPTYDDAMSSPGPYELPLADCLAINEFQPTNEPILVITASDPDDPETPNGQMDMAIINNQHQNELFALVPVRGGPQTSSPHSLAGSEPVTITPAAGRPSVSLAHLPPPPLPPSSTPSSDLSGFDGAEARRAKRSVASLPEPRFAPSPVHRSRLAPTTTDTPPPPQSTSPIPTTQMTRLALTSAPSGQQTGSGELQMHLVVSQSLKEKVGNYSILVRASDRASPSLSSVRLINVCVQDVNNHAPVFTRPPLNHTIRIMENATVGSFVTQVEASDADHGLNGELQYALKPTNIQNNNNDWQSFKIDRLSGAITTTKPFNRQQKKYYTLRVQAQDFGRPTSLSSDIDINIMIVNAGKYQPEFELQHQSLQFTENVAPNVEWFKLLQTTNLEDDPALIHMNQLEGKPAPPTQNWISSPCYYIVDGDDYDQVFHLDRYSHKLTNQKELDRERRSNYTLVVQASNNCNARPPPRPMTRALEGDETSAATTTRSSLMTAEESARSGGERFKRQLFAPKMGPVKRRDEPASEKLTAQGGAELGPAAQQAVDALVASDKSLLKVTIKIKDVNDNAPKFTQRIYTGGITTEADFGTVFMIVQAIDADSDANGQVTYSIVKPIKRNLSLMQGGNGLAGSGSNHQMGSPVDRQRRSTTAGADERAPGQTARYQQASPHDPTAPTDEEPHSGASSTTNSNLAVDANGGPNELGPQLADGDDLFVVSAQTGEISLNFDPQKQMKGYFEFEILAKDADGLSDSARVLIYLLRQDQRVKFVLRLTPQELRKRLNRFRSVFGNITGALVNIDSYKYFENHDGTVDKKKTSLYLHFVQPEDNTIIEVDKVLTLIDNNIEYLDELYKEFHVLSSEAAHLPLSSGALVDPIDQVRTSLMGISSFLALILVLVIALCLNQRTRYERQLKAAAVSAFGGPPLHLDPDFHSTTNLPNTNLHSQDPNPIWMNGHHYNSPTSANRMQDGPGGRGDDDGRGHWISNISGADCAKSTPGGNLKGQALSGRPAKASAQAARGKQQSLFHSASSGVGMTLDDDEELEELSTSGGEQSDMNSLTNVVAQHHHHHHYGGGGGAPTAATVTPRDSLDSSHGQVSSGSSSGANSTSTTNERQVLCSGNSKRPQQPPQPRPARGEPKEIRPARTGATNAGPSATTTLQSGASNSTFGAFKEVTIYTERPSKRPEVEQKQASQQSQASRLVSQFNSSRLQQINQQQQQRQSIYVGAEAGPPQPHKAHHPQQQQKSRVAVHANGAGAEQGAIKSAGHQAATKFDKLDAKFVPANDGASQPSRLANGSQQQDQSDNNFETSLSKLSILNLETTEL